MMIKKKPINYPPNFTLVQTLTPSTDNGSLDQLFQAPLYYNGF